MAKPPFDPITAYAPITLISTAPYLMVVHPSVPARSVRELVSIARARPGDLDYGSSGGGTLIGRPRTYESSPTPHGRCWRVLCH